MKCPKCKNSIPNNCKFCPECGADIRSASISTQSASPFIPLIAKPVENGKAKSGAESHAQNREPLKKNNWLRSLFGVSLNSAPIISKPDGNTREESRHNDGVQLWAGGPYWADRNIGAEKPEDSGYYFWWGDTVGYKHNGNSWVASNNSSAKFMFKGESVPTYSELKVNFAVGERECGVDIATLRCEGWITVKNHLTMEHDAAYVHCGEGWRMPTKQELHNIVNKCDWSGTMLNGIKGCLIRGRGAYVSNSIFLPAAGSGFETSIDDVGLRGDYWSSVPCLKPLIDDFITNNEAWMLRFDLTERGNIEDVTTFGLERYKGHPIRPVLVDSK